MFLLRESLGLILASGAIGYFCGWGKGRAGVGLLLGLALGPLGCLAIMLFPRASRQPMPGQPVGPESAYGERACPRCRKAVARADRVCPRCGNILMPIRYAVE